MDPVSRMREIGSLGFMLARHALVILAAGFILVLCQSADFEFRVLTLSFSSSYGLAFICFTMSFCIH